MMSLKDKIDAFKDMGNVLCNDALYPRRPPDDYAFMYNTFTGEKTFFWIHLNGNHGGYSADKVKAYQNMIIDQRSRSAKTSYDFMRDTGI